MKRYIVTTGLLAASLVLTGTASGAPEKPYDGKVKEGGLMRFDVKKPNNGLPVAKNFEFGKGVPTSCDEGDTAIGDHLVDTNIPFFAPRKFRLNSDFGDEVTNIDAEKQKSGKYKGTFRWKIDELDPGHHNCDTGKLHWTAKPSPPV